MAETAHTATLPAPIITAATAPGAIPHQAHLHAIAEVTPRHAAAIAAVALAVEGHLAEAALAAAEAVVPAAAAGAEAAEVKKISTGPMFIFSIRKISMGLSFTI